MLHRGDTIFHQKTDHCILYLIHDCDTDLEIHNVSIGANCAAFCMIFHVFYLVFHYINARRQLKLKWLAGTQYEQA